MYLILLGAPGTGKGTQASILAGRFGWLHISTGDLLREAVVAGSELGRQAKPYMDQGALVPDPVVIRALVERIGRPDAQQGFVLDGFPRTHAQAIALDAALAKEGKAIDLALNLDAPAEELLRRLTGRWLCPACGAIYHLVTQPPKEAGRCDQDKTPLVQREDDKPATVRARLERQRPPADLLQHYRGQNKLKEIDGSKTVADVTAALVRAMDAIPSGRGG